MTENVSLHLTLPSPSKLNIVSNLMVNLKGKMGCTHYSVCHSVHQIRLLKVPLTKTVTLTVRVNEA